jgi:hypothetical protein
MQMDVKVETVDALSCATPCGCGQDCECSEECNEQDGENCKPCEKQKDGAGQQLSSTKGLATKQDLDAAVQKIEQVEAKRESETKTDSTQSASDAHTQATAFPYCENSGSWRGPYGDACTAYEHGGDRAFWCKWDGADAKNACPRACGTCGAYWKSEDNQMLAQESPHAKGEPDVCVCVCVCVCMYMYVCMHASKFM